MGDLLDVLGEGPKHGVILKQVRSLLDTSRVVDDDDVKVGGRPLLNATQEVATCTICDTQQPLICLGRRQEPRSKN